MAKRRTKKPKIKSDDKALEKLGPDTQKNLKRKAIKLRSSTDPQSIKKKYSRDKPSRFLWFRHGYDLLQYSIVVRPYIMKKFKIDKLAYLEALLYLFPIQFFTIKDFQRLPVRQHNLYVKNLVEDGYLKIAVHKSGGSNIYTLSDHSVKIVKEYYEHLSGEKVLSAESYTNPFRGKESVKVDKLRERLMLRFKYKIEKNPDQFKKGLYE